jgi:6-phosphogluconate dehydrogenase
VDIGVRGIALIGYIVILGVQGATASVSVSEHTSTSTDAVLSTATSLALSVKVFLFNRTWTRWTLEIVMREVKIYYP